MAVRHRLTSVETVLEDGSWLFTVRDGRGDEEEVILVPCHDDDREPVEAWINRCTHEDQRLHREDVGAVIRDGEIVCPKHGSMFETCSGYCDNGEAADTTLVDVEIAVEDGAVYLTDDDVSFLREGGTSDDDGDEGPSSSSHIQF
ncbi:Rieske (2Fe-2S) protein [Natronococcus occultus]|uniref:Ferredoxin subunit of nitrite reductase and ring-hydroxylating dioxygenase n=1 Tax=Natronococcus occultus SP4 TaxID=694430 RepID=L0JSH2_9EURY|nr:Rieske 2Fe-2S domain-containing protein [Natronococcus occultus]AGB35947.1 ferredoxin subunit of nitrite reductase and ring-hydroxylating dioxygenase [Natronococcus occultus SP4]